MRLGKIERTVILDQSDGRFAGTEYANDDFSVILTAGSTGKVISKIARELANKDFEKMGGEYREWTETIKDKEIALSNLPETLLIKNLANNLIEEWSGFFDEDGNVLELTRENFLKMYEFDERFFSLLMLAYIDKTNPKETKEAESVVNDGMGKPSDGTNGDTEEAPTA